MTFDDERVRIWMVTIFKRIHWLSSSRVRRACLSTINSCSTIETFGRPGSPPWKTSSSSPALRESLKKGQLFSFLFVLFFFQEKRFLGFRLDLKQLKEASLLHADQWALETAKVWMATTQQKLQQLEHLLKVTANGSAWILSKR